VPSIKKEDIVEKHDKEVKIVEEERKDDKIITESLESKDIVMSEEPSVKEPEISVLDEEIPPQNVPITDKNIISPGTQFSALLSQHL
jgi:hypothetical protein